MVKPRRHLEGVLDLGLGAVLDVPGQQVAELGIDVLRQAVLMDSPAVEPAPDAADDLGLVSWSTTRTARAVPQPQHISQNWLAFGSFRNSGLGCMNQLTALRYRLASA